MARLQRDPAADLSPFRSAYVAHMLDRAKYYEDMAWRVLGRGIAHTMLVHHSLLSALFLGDLLEALERDGWTVIDAEEAYLDPVFRLQPDSVPAGESLVWSLAHTDPKFSGELRFPGEDEEYEKAILDRLEPPPAR
jgi:hypothetical protein